MKSLHSVIVPVSFLFCFWCGGIGRLQAAEPHGAPEFAAVERRAHETIWARVAEVLVSDGPVLLRRTNCYVELAAGLNFLDPITGRFEPADPSFAITPDGYASAMRTLHQVRISPRLNDAEGAVRITTPDGKVLRVTPAAMVLASRASGNVFVLGEFTNAVGQLVASNIVRFTNVLGPGGPRASMQMVNERGAFHADVILHERMDVAALERAGVRPRNFRDPDLECIPGSSGTGGAAPGIVAGNTPGSTRQDV